MGDGVKTIGQPELDGDDRGRAQGSAPQIVLDQLDTARPQKLLACNGASLRLARHGAVA
ncbi:MAG: hypothetical protein U0414_27770 [Polyangiaceae bacterium]